MLWHSIIAEIVQNNFRILLIPDENEKKIQMNNSFKNLSLTDMLEMEKYNSHNFWSLCFRLLKLNDFFFLCTR